MQVGRLIDAGEPDAERFGRSWVIDRPIDDDPRDYHGGAQAAIHPGAGIGRPDQRDIYISAGDADAFRAHYRANPNADDPNVVLRLVK